jgi:hypothetical protein
VYNKNWNSTLLATILKREMMAILKITRKLKLIDKETPMPFGRSMTKSQYVPKEFLVLILCDFQH